MTKTEIIRELLILSGHPVFWYRCWVLWISGAVSGLLGIVYPGVPGMIFAFLFGSAWGWIAWQCQDRFTQR